MSKTVIKGCTWMRDPILVNSAKSLTGSIYTTIQWSWIRQHYSLVAGANINFSAFQRAVLLITDRLSAWYDNSHGVKMMAFHRRKNRALKHVMSRILWVEKNTAERQILQRADSRFFWCWELIGDLVHREDLAHKRQEDTTNSIWGILTRQRTLYRRNWVFKRAIECLTRWTVAYFQSASPSSDVIGSDGVKHHSRWKRHKNWPLMLISQPEWGGFWAKIKSALDWSCHSVNWEQQDVLQMSVLNR